MFFWFLLRKNGNHIFIFAAQKLVTVVFIFAAQKLVTVVFIFAAQKLVTVAFIFAAQKLVTARVTPTYGQTFHHPYLFFADLLMDILSVMDDIPYHLHLKSVLN